MKKVVTWLRCRMCSEVFRKKSKRHFKCPRCGAHFTEETDPPEEASHG